MTRISLSTARFAGHTLRTADRADPLPPESLTATADLAIRFSLALMPFSTIAWLFIAH
ncbi:hypothetical protein NFI95_06215 [Acetobacteraceae bacterium KSS8]|uniref:Uncharacterized protein n=1 Tax=Endosaccharibacter trunci TaxID=2812733 RepID=A0ABT1W582_9PROT|nr:hypothetical protein [Acetobacteraceae bacterium KSS8]